MEIKNHKYKVIDLDSEVEAETAPMKVKRVEVKKTPVRDDNDG